MTALAPQLAALRACSERLEALDCRLVYAAIHAADATPTVYISGATPALLDWLDTMRMPIAVAFTRHTATFDGCAVFWPQPRLAA